MKKWIVGIDEAGRGPLAGPVSVGAVSVPEDFNWELLPGVNDSKKISQKKREVIFDLTDELCKKGELDYHVSMIASKDIDAYGIVPGISKAMERCLRKIAPDPEVCAVKLDGSLKAPQQYQHQETIIKGDQKEKVIGLASIMAKVTRDRYMLKVSTVAAYHVYDFAAHKGYGTKAHREAIATHGLSDIHRKSYCKNIVLL